MSILEGGCLCGAVRYRLEGAPKWTALCHCRSCTHAASAPVVAWMGYTPEQVTWIGNRTFYKSSEIATRGFCAICGTGVSFESTRWPGEIHLLAATLDEPENYTPDLHCHHAEHLSWLHIADDLPKHEASAP